MLAQQIVTAWMGQEPLVPPVSAPNQTNGVAATTGPIVACCVPSGAAMSTPQAGLGTLAPSYVEMEAERERALASVITFKMFNMPPFVGESVDPWVVKI